MAEIAVLPDRGPVPCKVLAVVAPEAPGRRGVPEIVLVRAPGHPHPREDVLAIQALRGGDRAIDRRPSFTVNGRKNSLVNAMRALACSSAASDEPRGEVQN